MTGQGGWLGPDFFRAGPGGELPVVAVTRLPPDLTGKLPPLSHSSRGLAQHLPPVPLPAGEPGYGEAPVEFSVVPVRGYRWWIAWPGSPGVLHGMHAAWKPGVNHAECLARPVPRERLVPGHGNVPEIRCTCGFYAGWTPQPPFSMSPLAVPVLGMIEGWGPGTLTGTKGFRCATARILALCPPYHEKAVIEALACAYPDAAIFPDIETLCAEFGPDENYGPRPA
jgi:hypothetical protein